MAITEKKIDRAIRLIYKNINLFSCPVCNEKIVELREQTLYCEKGHCFDISKKGSINLLSNKVKNEYGTELFEARNYICSIGFYEKLQKSLVKSLEKLTAAFDSKKIRIMDVGCGEGSHLKYIINYFQNTDALREFEGVGLDISKNAINVAARDYSDIIWCVADLAKQPFAEKSLDIILNVLSPANYQEFKRLLTAEGLILKVVPGSHYLKELREAFYSETEKAVYSNERIIKHLKENINVIYEENLKYTVNLSKQDLKKLIAMTPLSWSVDEVKVEEFLSKEVDTITIDLLLIGGTIK